MPGCIEADHRFLYEVDERFLLYAVHRIRHEAERESEEKPIIEQLMKEKELKIQYQIAELSELSETEQELVKKAMDATNHAYANYSHFYVGAACLLADGKMVIGANQENAAFPSGLCAERSAIFGAQSYYPELAITTLAIAARNENGFLKSPISPCGACRQVILEMEDRYQQPVRILLYGENGIFCFHSIKDLLPFSFVDANMKE